MFEHLLRKGWEQREIQHLQQHYVPKKEARILTFGAFVLLGFAACLIPYTYGRIGHYLTDALFHVTLAIVTVPVGGVFGILLSDLDRLDKTHHRILFFVVPALVFVAGLLFFTHSNNTAVTGMHIHNALIAGVLYAITFTTPYVLVVARQWNSRIGR